MTFTVRSCNRCGGVAFGTTRVCRGCAEKHFAGLGAPSKLSPAQRYGEVLLWSYTGTQPYEWPGDLVQKRVEELVGRSLSNQTPGSGPIDTDDPVAVEAYVRSMMTPSFPLPGDTQAWRKLAEEARDRQFQSV